MLRVATEQGVDVLRIQVEAAAGPDHWKYASAIRRRMVFTLTPIRAAAVGKDS